MLCCISVSFTFMSLECCLCVREPPTGMVPTLQTFEISRGMGSLKELKLMCNEELRNSEHFCSYVKFFAPLCAFSIVPSYSIYIKRPHTFLRVVRTLRETVSGTLFWGRAVVSSIAVGIALPTLGLCPGGCTPGVVQES